MDPLDDLLIKRRRGTLTAAERRRLDAARRASPEYDLALLAQGAFERDGTPQPADAERLRQLVAAVERRLPPPRAPARWRSLLRRLAPPLFFAGAAAASIGELLPSEPAVSPAAVSPAALPPPAVSSSGVPSHSAPPEPAEASARASVEPIHAPPPPPEPSRAPRSSARTTPLQPEAPRTPAAAPATLAPPRATASPAPSDESAQSLFRRASRLRSVDWPAAAAVYVELVRRYPSSNEAGVAEVALGKWSFAQGRSGDALEWFRAHLRRAPGALTAEALFGEARALESIGADGEAQAPWRRLLDLYPASPYANVARQRLAP